MAPPSAASDLDRGRRIGKYQILTRLSVGGMAELFLAYTAGPGGFKKFVALKQILPDIKADESFVKMFLDEARITAAFNNANIGQVFDLGEDEGELYLAMEFIAGQNLEQVIKRAAKRQVPLPVGFAARVIRDTCLGLHYAHHFTEPSGAPAPVIHRDVSPKNVMVTYSGDVKVIDFGIAKAKGRLGRTQVGIVKGTSGYMSPEQVRNEPLDGRTDLFCTATMLYELLSGERLFSAVGEVQMMLKIAEEETPAINTVNPEVPQALADVVARGLQKKRDARFASGKEFARAIEQATPEMFDEEQIAALMTELFDDKIATTRSLLELAKAEDTGAMTRAVEQLKSDAEEALPGKKDARGKATPAPRAGLATPTRASKPAPKKEASHPPPRRTRAAPRPAAEPEPADDVDATIPPNRVRATDRHSAPRPAEPPEVESAATESRPAHRGGEAARNTQDLPAIRARARGGEQPKSGGALGLVLFALFVAAVGGVVWAGWKGPLKDSGPAQGARLWLDRQVNGEPPPPPPPALQDLKPATGGPKPAWMVEKEKRDAAERAERERQAQTEAAANDPETQKYLKDLDEQLAKLNQQEEELRRLKAEASTAKVQGDSNTKKIDDMQKQIDDLKSAIAAKEKKRPAPRAPGVTGEVAVVKDDRTAKRADIGYLSLFTLNPGSTKVFLGAETLGSTPIVKVPLEAGVHLLRIVDGESKDRQLSVKIESGKTAEMKGVNVGTLPLLK